MKAWILVAMLAANASAQQESPQHHLVGIDGHDPHALTVAAETGIALDCQSLHPDGTLEILATDSDLEEFRRRGAVYRHLQDNLEQFYADRLKNSDYLPPANNPPFGGGSMGGYFTLAEIESILDDFATTYPGLCTGKVSIGTSVEGRDIWMVKISDNPGVDENEPEARFDALHHAREPMSMTSLLYYMNWLLTNYGTDPLATFLVDEREIYFVPVVNPDGYEYNRQTNPNGGGLWRKNRRNNGGGTFGVDLNRNYTYRWGYNNGGSSGNPSSEVYRGPSAGSEPETQAMIAFISGRDFQVANSAHSYSNLWLYAWGFDCSDPADKAGLNLQGQWFTAENGYPQGTICQVLYDANGNTVDYDYANHGIFSGTVEIGSSGDGFWPDTSRIIPLAEDNLRANQRLSTYAGAGVENSGLSWVESVGDGDAYYEPGERFTLSTSLINPGVAATNTNVTLQVSIVGSAIQLVDGDHDFGVLGALGGSADNLGAPLEIEVSAGANDGDLATLITELSWDGYTERREVDVIIGAPWIFHTDTLQKDLGWTLGAAGDDATTGLWEIANPQQTSSGGDIIQPEDDHSPGGGLCAVTDGRAGSGAGSWDVDNGRTTLTSPQFDLEDLAAPVVSYWRWFATGDDRFTAEISNDDGQSWTTVEVLSQPVRAWEEVRFSPASLLPLTDRMRMRFWTSDAPNNDLTEALVDDLRIETGASSSTLFRYGSALVGQPVKLAMRGQADLGFVLYAATAGGYYDLGSLGIWELDFASMFKILNGSLGADGVWNLNTDLPNDPGLSGVEVHLQAMVLDPMGPHFSNAIDMLVE